MSNKCMNSEQIDTRATTQFLKQVVAKSAKIMVHKRHFVQSDSASKESRHSDEDVYSMPAKNVQHKYVIKPIQSSVRKAFKSTKNTFTIRRATDRARVTTKKEANTKFIEKEKYIERDQCSCQNHPNQCLCFNEISETIQRVLSNQPFTMKRDEDLFLKRLIQKAGKPYHSEKVKIFTIWQKDKNCLGILQNNYRNIMNSLTENNDEKEITTRYYELEKEKLLRRHVIINHPEVNYELISRLRDTARQNYTNICRNQAMQEANSQHLMMLKQKQEREIAVIEKKEIINSCIRIDQHKALEILKGIGIEIASTKKREIELKQIVNEIGKTRSELDKYESEIDEGRELVKLLNGLAPVMWHIRRRAMKKAAMLREQQKQINVTRDSLFSRNASQSPDHQLPSKFNFGRSPMRRVISSSKERSTKQPSKYKKRQAKRQMFTLPARQTSNPQLPQNHNNLDIYAITYAPPSPPPSSPPLPPPTTTTTKTSIALVETSASSSSSLLLDELPLGIVRQASPSWHSWSPKSWWSWAEYWEQNQYDENEEPVLYFKDPEEFDEAIDRQYHDLTNLLECIADLQETNAHATNICSKPVDKLKTIITHLQKEIDETKIAANAEDEEFIGRLYTEGIDDTCFETIQSEKMKYQRQIEKFTCKIEEVYIECIGERYGWMTGLDMLKEMEEKVHILMEFTENTEPDVLADCKKVDQKQQRDARRDKRLNALIKNAVKTGHLIHNRASTKNKYPPGRKLNPRSQPPIIRRKGTAKSEVVDKRRAVREYYYGANCCNEMCQILDSVVEDPQLATRRFHGRL